LLDEPTEGLAPVIVQQIGRTIAQLKAQGFTILLVEQNSALPRPSPTAITWSITGAWST
jgi:ABC-type branched-subunit amino acid transport system ATPase component